MRKGTPTAGKVQRSSNPLDPRNRPLCPINERRASRNVRKYLSFNRAPYRQTLVGARHDVRMDDPQVSGQQWLILPDELHQAQSSCAGQEGILDVLSQPPSSS
jgi:hypothetical protein